MSNDWMTGGHRPRRGIDVMQVCENGHKVTDQVGAHPERAAPFCDKCGGATTTSCAYCGNPIPGFNHDNPALRLGPPKNCRQCGSAFPWRQAAIANAIGVLEELGLEEADMTTAKEAVPELIGETPKVELAVLRLRRVLSKLGKPAYDVGIKVISDLASETIKKALLRP